MLEEKEEEEEKVVAVVELSTKWKQEEGSMTERRRR